MGRFSDIHPPSALTSGGQRPLGAAAAEIIAATLGILRRGPLNLFLPIAAAAADPRETERRAVHFNN